MKILWLRVKAFSLEDSSEILEIVAKLDYSRGDFGKPRS